MFVLKWAVLHTEVCSEVGSAVHHEVCSEVDSAAHHKVCSEVGGAVHYKEEGVESVFADIVCRRYRLGLCVPGTVPGSAQAVVGL